MDINSVELAMNIYKQSITVPFSYPVFFTRGMWDENSSVISNIVSRRDNICSKALVYIDNGVADNHPGISASISKCLNASSITVRMDSGHGFSLPLPRLFHDLLTGKPCCSLISAIQQGLTVKQYFSLI